MVLEALVDQHFLGDSVFGMFAKEPFSERPAVPIGSPPTSTST